MPVCSSPCPIRQFKRHTITCLSNNSHWATASSQSPHLIKPHPYVIGSKAKQATFMFMVNSFDHFISSSAVLGSSCTLRVKVETSYCTAITIFEVKNCMAKENQATHIDNPTPIYFLQPHTITLTPFSTHTCYVYHVPPHAASLLNFKSEALSSHPM